MSEFNSESKMYFFMFLFISVCFFNLSLLDGKLDVFTLILGIIILLLVFYSNFIIRRFYPDGDKYILLFCNMLSIIGIVMLYRLDRLIAIKQVIWFTFGIGAFIIFVVLISELRDFSKYKYTYLIFTLIFMSLGTFLGTELSGAKNWIIIYKFSFQPSEFGKLTLIAYLASVLEDYNKEKKKFSIIEDLLKNYKMNESFKVLIEPALVVMISLGFMVLQRDLGSALIIFGISLAMLYIATNKAKYIFTCMGLFTVGSVISYKLFYHVRKRIIIWKEPWKYAYNESYQIVQSLIAICSGGFFGSGLGLGQPNAIPVVTTDFIFAAICEEMGVLMGIAILIFFFLMFYRCMRVAVKVDDKFLMLLAIGISTMIASEALVIIGGVLSVIPLTGIALPFVSYGGTSMLISYFALGIVQKISEEAC